jgi:hypothetical protein
VIAGARGSGEEVTEDLGGGFHVRSGLVVALLRFRSLISCLFPVFGGAQGLDGKTWQARPGAILDQDRQWGWIDRLRLRWVEASCNVYKDLGRMFECESNTPVVHFHSDNGTIVKE